MTLVRFKQLTFVFHCSFLVEVFWQLPVTSDKLWQPVNRADFGNWIQSNDYELAEMINCTFSAFSERPVNAPLKFMYRGQTESNVPKSDITFLKPLFDLQTLSNHDVEVAVQDFHDTYIAPTNRQFAVVSGDFQVWDKLFMLHVRNPVKYQWLIPVPGEWHWTWHIIIAIFKVFYTTILFPFATLLGFKKLDPKAANFHYAEDFLQILTIAVHAWIVRCLAANPRLTSLQWLSSIKRNTVAYELAYACIYYFIPYWATRSALKWNKYEDIQNWWRYWVHLFLATRKSKYCLMSIRFLMILWSLHPDVKDLFNKFRVLSFSGDEGTGIPMDGVCELAVYTFP
jgi:hypothetical protein